MKKGVCTFLLLFALGLVFVTSVDAAGSHVVERGDTLAHIARLHGTTWPVLAEYNGLTNPHLIFPRQVVRIPSGLYRVWTVEELGEIIVAAGRFWEEFNGVTGRFSYENHDMSGRIQGTHPRHLEQFTALMPASGFESVNDVRSFLLRYYTESWVDALLYGEFPPFVDYEGVLYMHAGVVGPPSEARPDWDTATHMLLEKVEKKGYVVIVATTVLHRSWQLFYMEGVFSPLEVARYPVTHYFEFVEGTINVGPNARSVTWGDKK